MPRYNVHVYREMRLRFDSIEAATLQAAAEKARDLSLKAADDFDECDGEAFAALVDAEGDEDYSDSLVIDFDAGRLQKAASGMLAALLAILPYAEGELGSLRECHRRDGDLEAEVAEAEERVAQAWKAVGLAEGRAA